MTSASITTVRLAYAALSRGDAGALRDLAVPDLVLDFSRRLIDPVVTRDREEAFVFLQQTRETWDGYPAWEPQELLEAGDKVVALVRTSARGKGSDAKVEANVWNVWTFRGGKVTKLVYFGDDRAAALEAAGLPE